MRGQGNFGENPTTGGLLVVGDEADRWAPLAPQAHLTMMVERESGSGLALLRGLAGVMDSAHKEKYFPFYPRYFSYNAEIN
jgi:hypothetical protein